MAGDLVHFDLAAAVRKSAAVERDRISAILAAIQDVRAASAALQDDRLSEAGEHLALERLDRAEERLLGLILEPGFGIYQRHLLAGLTDFAAGGK